MARCCDGIAWPPVSPRKPWPSAPGSGGPAYEGAASTAWDDTAYWRPEPGADAYKTRWGFPAYPGLLDAAMSPFEAQGSSLPWL